MRANELPAPMAGWIAELRHASGSIQADVLDALDGGSSPADVLRDAEAAIQQLAAECAGHLQRIASLRRSRPEPTSRTGAAQEMHDEL